MSAAEIISQIKKLPQSQRKNVFRFVDEQLRRTKDTIDNAAADRALAESGENIPWSEAQKNPVGRNQERAGFHCCPGTE